MHTTTLSVLSAAAMTAILSAQSPTVTVPKVAETMEGQLHNSFPFGWTTFHTQFVIDGEALAPTCAALFGISFRPDNFSTSGSAGVTFTNVVIKLGNTFVVPDSTSPGDGMSPTFAMNAPTGLTTVYSGAVILPPHSASPGAPAPWVRITFPSPIVFIRNDPNGGNMVVDITATGTGATASTGWNADIVRPGGRAMNYGTHGPMSVSDSVSFSTVAPSPVGLGPDGAVSVGHTFSIRIAASQFGTTNWTGSALLGLRLPSPIDLAPIGATGNTLYVNPLVTVPFTMARPMIGFGGPVADLPVSVPNDPNLNGATLDVQAAILDTPANQLGLVLSGGSKLFIGASRHPINQVNSKDPTATAGTFFSTSYPMAAALQFDAIVQ